MIDPSPWHIGLAGESGASMFQNRRQVTQGNINLGSLNEVSLGANGVCGAPLCAAGIGWDGPTGRGTPNGVAAFTPAVAATP